MQWLFLVIYQTQKGVQDQLSVHIFSIIFPLKCSLILYQLTKFNVISFFLLKILIKMCYKVLIQAIADVLNFKIYLPSSSKPMTGREKKGKTEIQKFEYLDNEKRFQMKSIFRNYFGCHLVKKKNEKQRIQALKVVSAIFLLVYFVYLKQSAFRTREFFFNLTSKALFFS